ncbi:MAG: hypothetical protein ACUZ77_06235 [Candidatus Brocadiales bacterium]
MVKTVRIAGFLWFTKNRLGCTGPLEVDLSVLQKLAVNLDKKPVETGVMPIYTRALCVLKEKKVHGIC